MNTFVSSEYATVLGDPSFRLTAERLALKVGVRADLTGYTRLVDAIILYGTGMTDGFCSIYRAIGEARDIRYKSVMREIAYAINMAFDLPRKLSDLVGVKIPPADIHSALVIAYLGKIFQNPSLALYK